MEASECEESQRIVLVFVTTLELLGESASGKLSRSFCSRRENTSEALPVSNHTGRKTLKRRQRLPGVYQPLVPHASYFVSFYYFCFALFSCLMFWELPSSLLFFFLCT